MKTDFLINLCESVSPLQKLTAELAESAEFFINKVFAFSALSAVKFPFFSGAICVHLWQKNLYPEPT